MIWWMDLRYGPPSRYLWMVGLGIGCTLVTVVVCFAILIAVGVLSHDGPSDSLFLSAPIFAGLIYAGLIALHTSSVWNGLVVGILVPGLIVGGLFFIRSSLTADYGPCGPAAACSVSDAPAP